jgi:PAS domain S-box-containing protein
MEMKIYEFPSGMYVYKHLPAFAQYLLDHHLEEFIRDQVKLSYEVNLPLLKHMQHYTEEQIIAISKQTTAEYLTYLATNDAKAQLVNSFTRWISDQLKIVGKFDISAEDITVFNYMRGKLMKKWIRKYDIPADDKFELMDEIDNLLFGNTTSATNTFINILKQKIEEESHFNAQLINTSPGIIFIYDIEKQKDIYINGNVEEVMGYSKEEVLKMGNNFISSLTHPDDLAILIKGIENILVDDKEKSNQIEYRFRHKDGSYKWLRSYATIFKRDEAGKVLQLLGTCFEITKEKETALALVKREAQMLEAQAIAHLGSFEWDLTSNTVINTPQLQEIFEFQNHEAQTQFITRVHPEDKERVERAIAESFISGRYDCQYRYLVNDKEKVLWARGVIQFKDEKPAIMHGTVQDITQLKNIEHELMRKTKELERSNESLQQFASVASHDLKEPLRKMSMYSDMVLTLEEGKISESSLTNLEKVKSSSIRMQNMIEDILNFSSISHEARKQRVSLQKVLHDAIDILQESIAEKNAIITSDELPEAYVISSQIRQLFQNLIANALKFSKKDISPVIHISHRVTNKISEGDLEAADTYLQIIVQDNGIGFKQEYAKKIFVLFTRLHARATYEGSGLGLSICKRIVENHGGSITAESQPGQGSTFIITLPAAKKR